MPFFFGNFVWALVKDMNVYKSSLAKQSKSLETNHRATVDPNSMVALPTPAQEAPLCPCLHQE